MFAFLELGFRMCFLKDDKVICLFSTKNRVGLIMLLENPARSTHAQVFRCFSRWLMQILHSDYSRIIMINCDFILYL